MAANAVDQRRKPRPSDRSEKHVTGDTDIHAATEVLTWPRRVLTNALRRARRVLQGGTNGFLRHTKGAIHVGGNVGQERQLYAKHGLPVLWVEPIPEVFEQLERNIEAFPRQRAVRALVTDQDAKPYEFHVASNRGASSSILPLDQHTQMWPHVHYTDTLALESCTLPALLETEQIDPVDYDSLILDTQGSELLVLQGASELLRGFRFIKTEVADFESYRGCCTVDQLGEFLDLYGFKEYVRKRFAFKANLGAYFDIVYRRAA